ncbi:MAG: M56 family metallopeptidase [Clostridiaceae bacterium]
MTELFRTILNMSVTGAIAVLGLLLLRFPLRRAPRWIRCALWAVVFLRLAVPFSFSAPVSLLGGVGAPAPENGMVTYIAVDNAAALINDSGIASEASVPIASELSAESAVSLAPTPQASVDPTQIWLAVGSAVWLTGTAGILLYAVILYARLRRRVGDAVLVEPGVFETDAVTSPFVIGVLRPRIILPVDMDQGTRELVLRHERAHIKRFDHVAKPAAFLLLAVHWFNPLVWLAFHLFCEDMETCCDEQAIRALTREQIAAYGESLLRLGTRRVSFAGGPLAFGEHCTKGRIMNVLNYKKPAFWVIAAAIVLAVGAAVVLLANPVSLNTARELTDDELQYVEIEVTGDIQMVSYYSPRFTSQKAVKEGLPDLNKFEPQTSATLLRYDLIDGISMRFDPDVRLDLSLLNDTDNYANMFTDFFERLANGQLYIQAYLQKNATGCYNTENATKLTNYEIINGGEYTCNLNCEEIYIQTGNDYTRCAQQYLFALMNANELHWQQFGYAQYLGSVLNPYDMTLAKLAEEGIDTSKPYAQAYLDQGGNEKNLTKEDYRLLVDAAASYCLQNGMNWGTLYESTPIRSLEEFGGEPQKGDDMSVMMASSFCAYLADNYGFDKLTSYCFGQTEFKNTFGVSFDRAYSRWQKVLDKQFS